MDVALNLGEALDSSCNTLCDAGSSASFVIAPRRYAAYEAVTIDRGAKQT